MRRGGGVIKIPAPAFSVENSVVESIRDPLAIAVYAYVSFREQDPPERDEIRDHFALSDEDLDRALTLLEQAGLLHQSDLDAQPVPASSGERPHPRPFAPADLPSCGDDASDAERSRGYVYVLSNPSMPGIVKVGRSIYGGRHRAKELYKSITGVPAPFRVEFEILIDDHSLLERRIHEKLASARVNNAREFFRCDVDEAIHVALAVVAESRSMSYVASEVVIDDCLLSECARLADTHSFMVADAIREIPAGVILPYVLTQKERVMRINAARHAARQLAAESSRMDGAQA